MAIIILSIVIVLIIFYIIISNNINRAIVKIDEASSGIDVALTKRYDVLTKMIEVVNSYSNHEKDVLFKVVDLRKGMSIEERNKANKSMDENFSKINALAENYPELRSSDNYLTLQQSIIDVEEHLQASRRLYNSNVSNYNQLIVTFPSSIIAKSKALTIKSFFEAESLKKKDVDINL